MKPPVAHALVFAAVLSAGVLPPAAAQGPGGLNGAVVFAYHRFGEDHVPATNTRLEQFEAHLEELRTGGYTVLPLQEIVAAMEAGRPLPDRTVALTVDDAYRSIYTEAWPRIRAAGFPFTVFVATDLVDRSGGGGTYMTWDEIRELAADGVGIGGHSASHPHFPDLRPEEIRAELERSAAAFRRELGWVPTLFAYPFGEASLVARQLVIEAGYSAAFGQHSGVAEAGLDQFYLPRFALNETYGALPRFQLAASALPFGAREVVPEDPTLRRNPPAFGFTIAEGVDRLDRMNCFASHETTPARIERLGARRFEVRVDRPFPAGRARFNCTLPAADGRWRWFGIQFYVPRS